MQERWPCPETALVEWVWLLALTLQVNLVASIVCLVQHTKLSSEQDITILEECNRKCC